MMMVRMERLMEMRGVVLLMGRWWKTWKLMVAELLLLLVLQSGSGGGGGCGRSGGYRRRRGRA